MTTEQAKDQAAGQAQAPEQEAVAWSLSARSFEFSAPLAAMPPIGALVTLTTGGGKEFLGQVVETLEVERTASAAGGARVSGRGTLVAQRSGSDLTPVGPYAVLADSTMRAAEPAVVRAWQEASGRGRTVLPLGSLAHPASEPAQLTAAGFNRHTFLCGQSGSGKTYALGVVLEQLLLDTRLKIVVLDPNSDYVHLDSLAGEPGAGGPIGPIAVFRTTGAHRLKIRYGRLPFRQQALVVALDPIRDADEYDLLRRLAEETGSTEYSLREMRARAAEVTGEDEEIARRLVLRIDNLGVADWSIWANADETPLMSQLPDDWRAAVIDLGDLPTSEERSAVVASILSGLWMRRVDKEPILVVIDEAHNVCPQEPTDVHQALAIEHAQRIAAEGRKYGLYLLLSTQSPRKLHQNVLTQCENLLLMKMNSAPDVARVADVFSHVPAGLISQATGFALGEGLAAGRISPVPQLFHSGKRVSPEGGADIPTTWADPV